MDTSAGTQWKVGVFLTAGLAIILITIFTLGSNRSVFGRYFVFKSNFENIQGLNVGSVVSIAGITIGNVEEVEFKPESKFVEVKFKVQYKFHNLLRRGLRVDIRTQGALGDKYIYIIPGNPNEELIADGEFVESEKSVDIMNIISQRGNDTEKVFDTINEVYTFMHTLNKNNRFDNIIQNFNQTSENLNSSSVQIKSLIKETKINIAISKMDQILNKIDTGQGTLGALINDPSLYLQIKSILGQGNRKEHVKSLLRTSIEKSEKN